MNISHKVKIHFFTYIIMIIALFTGLFKELSMIMILIIIHEFGHILGSCIYKWKIDRIVILPFGGITIFNEKLNRPIKEEIIILIMGPLFQVIGYYILRQHFNYIFMVYHYTLLIFNLLPIYPLDGSKLVHLVLACFITYKRSHIIMIHISFISLFLVFVLCFISHVNLLLILIFILLFIRTIEELSQHNSIMNKFFYERYSYDLSFKKVRKIKNLNLNYMYRDYRHIFFDGKYYITEKENLKKMFDFKRNM